MESHNPFHFVMTAELNFFDNFQLKWYMYEINRNQVDRIIPSSAPSKVQFTQTQGIQTC